MSYTNLVDEVQKVIDLILPCEAETDVELLCDDCPWNIIPEVDCGIHKLQERAMKMRKEGESNE